jgi:hypothetical protein
VVARTFGGEQVTEPVAGERPIRGQASARRRPTVSMTATRDGRVIGGA